MNEAKSVKYLIESNEVKLPMMPSALASFAMLRNYIAQVD